MKTSKAFQYTISILVLSILVGVIYFIYPIYSNHLWEKRTRELAETDLRGRVNEIEEIILSIQQIPLNLAYVLEFSKPKKDQLYGLLHSIVSNNDEVYGTCIAFEPNSFSKDSMYYAPYLFKKNGEIVSVNPSDTTYHYFSMDWYLIPKTLKKPVWIEPYFDEGTSGGNIVLATYSMPFYYCLPFYHFDAVNEVFKGVVTVDVSIEWLSKKISALKFGKEGYYMLVSENGTIISAPDPYWSYNESLFSLAEENNWPVLREIGRDLQQQKSGFKKVGKFITNKDWWIYYMPIPANKWGVLLVMPEERH